MKLNRKQQNDDPLLLDIQKEKKSQFLLSFDGTSHLLICLPQRFIYEFFF